MKILFLPNWKVNFMDADNHRFQAPDKYIKGEPYWFFKYFPIDTLVDVVDIHSRNCISRIEKRIKFYIIQAFIAYKIQNNYDVIISHGAQSGVMLALLRVLFGKGNVKHIIFDIGGMNGARRSGFSTQLIKFAMKSNPYIICHSTNIQDNLKITYPWLLNNSIFIHFGIGTYQYNLDVNIKTSKKIFVFSGAKRDEETVIEAWKEIIKDASNKGYTLYLVGTSNNVEIPFLKCIKRLMYNDYIELLSTSAFVILPLFDYNYSYGQMSLLGAMAMGKKIIASEVGGISDYLAHCRTVIKVPEKNVNQMISKIIYCIENPISDQEKLKIRSEVELNFNEEDMAIKILNYMQEKVLL